MHDRYRYSPQAGPLLSCPVSSRPNAASRVRMSRASVNGFRRKATAPPDNARCRAAGSSCAVIKMIGIAPRVRRIWVCTSIPLRPGICMSSTTQSGWNEGSASTRSTNSALLPQVSAVIPKERMSRLSARHTDSSSSTMAMRGFALFVTCVCATYEACSGPRKLRKGS